MGLHFYKEVLEWGQFISDNQVKRLYNVDA